MDRKSYFEELLRLQKELVKLQDWVVLQKLKVVVLFEGRDAAGKGGVIKRVTQRLNPRTCKVVALTAPTERERTQWYFQRYVHCEEFFRSVPDFERMLVRSGIILIKCTTTVSSTYTPLQILTPTTATAKKIKHLWAPHQPPHQSASFPHCFQARALDLADHPRVDRLNMSLLHAAQLVSMICHLMNKLGGSCPLPAKLVH
jgi:Polyphosphate kinase 2 (PPK2)